MQLCCQGWVKKQQIDAAVRAHRAQAVTFQACNAQLEVVPSFKYLGRYFTTTDSDWPAVYKNLKKAREKWAMVSKVLMREGASPRVSGLFYKVVVQSVLLYGSESWVVTPAMLKVLSSFHHQVACQITNRMARKVNGNWYYPYWKWPDFTLWKNTSEDDGIPLHNM